MGGETKWLEGSGRNDADKTATSASLFRDEAVDGETIPPEQLLGSWTSEPRLQRAKATSASAAVLLERTKEEGGIFDWDLGWL
jgi:hypothetical protein